MFKALLKVNIAATFSSFVKFNKSGEKKKKNPLGKVGMGILLVYLALCFNFMFGSLFIALAMPLSESGAEELYFAVAGIMGLLLGIIGSVFITQKQLFEAQDNELLLSMPIPSHIILLSRMLSLLVINYVYMALAVVPAFVVWGILGLPVTTAGVLFTAVAFLALPFAAMTVSCILAWIIASIGSRMRDKRLVTMVASLLFLGGYFYVYFSLSTNMAVWIERISQNAAGLLLTFKTNLAPLYWLGDACANGNALSLLLYLLCCGVPFGAVCLVLSKSFIRIATTKRSVKKKKYIAGNTKVRSPFMALVGRETARFFGSPTYMLNCGIGLIMIGGFTVFGALKLNDLPDFMKNDPAALGYIVACVIAALNGTVYISAASVSLEGKNIWISQTCPVSAATILRSKVFAHILICLPVEVPCAIAAAILVKTDIITGVMAVVMPIAAVVFCAYLGLCLNLRFPRLDWLNETAVIKQGMAALFAMLIPMGLFVGLLFVGLALADYIGWALFLGAATVLLAIVCLIMDGYIHKGGAAKYSRL